MGRKWQDLPFRRHIWSESDRIYHLDDISGLERDKVFRLQAISGSKVDGFTVKGPYLGRKWTYLPFRGHIWSESDRIYRLEDMCESKMDGFTI